MHLYKMLGAKCTRSAASLGIWDFIAIGNDNISLVQVKSNKRPPKKEMVELIKFPNIYCKKCGNKISNKVLHVWRDYCRKPIIEIIGEEFSYFKVLDYYINSNMSIILFKVIKENKIYFLEKFCENINIINLKIEIKNLENLSIEDFKFKYDYNVYKETQ